MNIQNPYKGLFQYSSSDEKIFFGRNQEAEEIIELIKNNQLVTIYGESGTGKTSLINAKIFPELRRQYYFPIYIRLNYISGHDPLAQVKQKIYSDLKIWDADVPDFSPNQTLIEYASATSIFNGLIKPVLFFDQFEELFTLGPRYTTPQAIKALIDEIADLVEVRLPQIENVQTNDDRQIFTENVLKFSVVFSLRQDYIAQLDDYKYKIPSIIFGKYRLKKFNFIQAYEAINNPTKEINVIENNRSEKIIDEPTSLEIIRVLGEATVIADEIKLIENEKLKKVLDLKPTDDELESLKCLTVDPTLLSLYCYQLYENASKNTFPITITKELVKSHSSDNIIKYYYKTRLHRFRKVKKAIERHLITRDGRRLLKPLNVFLSESKLNEKDVYEVVQTSAILRLYGEKNDREIEIVHDQIAKRALTCRKIRESNRIKIYSTFIGIGILLIASLITTLYTNSKKKESDVKNLLNKEKALKAENKILKQSNDKKDLELITLRNEYASVSAFQFKFENNDQRINDQIKYLGLQLRQKIEENDSLISNIIGLKTDYKNLTDHITVINSQYSNMESLLSREKLKANECQKRLNEVVNKVKREIDAAYKGEVQKNKSLQADIQILTGKLKLKEDSLKVYKELTPMFQKVQSQK